MEENWFASCYRKLFLDYHLQQSAVGVGKTFDGEAWAQALQEAGVQGVSCFAKCAFGWRYYQKGSAGRTHPNLPEGMDLLEDTIRECHKRGIRVVAYYHTFGSEYYAALHPEWRITNAKGEADFRGICLLSPGVELEMLPQITEIAENYKIDGMFFDGTYADGSICYCESCKKRYREETGRELPASKEDPGYKAYAKWSMDAYQTLRQRIMDAVHKGRPDALVAINWSYSPRQVEPVPSGIGFLSEDIGPANMLSYASLVARYWALSGTPFDVMNHMALKWWLEWGLKPVNSLLQESAVILANGGKTWVGYQMYPEYGVHPYLFETLKKNFDFVRGLEPVLLNSKPRPYVGVLHGEGQIGPDTSGGYRVFADESSLKGVHRALTFSGIPYHSCSNDVFLKHLSRFRAVILSGGQPLREDVLAAVEQYVREGGSLLVTGTTGFVDKQGAFTANPLLERVLGVAVTDEYPYSHGYFELEKGQPIAQKTMDMPMLCSRPFTCVRETTASVLGTTRGIYLRADGKPMFCEFASRTTFSPPGESTGSPSVTVNRYGKGCAVYLASDIFASYAGGSQWYFKNLVKNILNQYLLGDDALLLEAPDYIEVSLMERENELHIHLTNLSREWPDCSFGEATEYVIGEEILPIHDVRVSLPKGLSFKEASLADGQPLPWEEKDGRATLLLDRLELHACLVLKGVAD